MKKFFKYLLVFLIVVGGVFLLGPRPDTNTTVTFDPASLPADLDAYLADSEKDIANLTPGAEKQIIWNNPDTREKTEIAIVFMHGFSATNREIRPVPDRVAKSLSANLYFTRFKGHGRDGEGLAEATTQAWANDAAEAMAIGERLGEKVIIISVSTGGTLATWTAAQPDLTKKLAGIAFISPNFAVNSLPTWLPNIPWAETIFPAIFGSERSWEPKNEEHNKWWTRSYPTKAVFPMTSFLKVIDEIDKSTLSTPALFMYSDADTVVDPKVTASVAEKWLGANKTVKVTSSGDPNNHVIAGDIMSPGNNFMAIKTIVTWIKQLN